MTTSTLRDRRNGAGERTTSPVPSDAQLDLLAEFSSELERLSATQRELLQGLRSDGYIDLDAEEFTRLREENAALRAHFEELDRQPKGAAPASWAEKQAEYESLLEEKSEIIRELHQKIKKLEEEPVITPESEAKVHDAVVEKMRRDLEEQRRQLERDEASMMEQMRNMELALAKDRAELARLRTELQRQQADFAREMELAGRDQQLRERLATLQRRTAEPAGDPASEAPPPAASESPSGSTKKSSSLIRRLFG